MFRSRLASVVVLAGLGLTSGCMSLSEHPLFNRGCNGSSSSCASCPPACPCAGVPGCGCATTVPGCPSCGGAGVPVYSDGPILDGGPMGAPGYGGAMLNPPLPQQTVPPLAPAPRLVPQPQAPVAPYTPTMRELR